MQASGLEYALYLCHGHSAGSKDAASSPVQQDGKCQVVVLDEMGMGRI
jgi:hypothetical protein